MTPPTLSSSDVKPYYEDEYVTLYHGDCRDVLPLLPEGVAAVVLTDPPYSSGGFQESGRSAGSIGTRTSETIQYDNLSTRGYERLMREVLRGVNYADEIFLFSDWRMWIPAFDAVEGAGWRVRNMLVWDKVSMGMGMPWRNQHELIVYGKRAPAAILDGKMGNVLRSKRSGNANHPTEKPVDLIQLLIANTVGGDIIDPFCGSGTTLVAAKNLGRHAIGIEIDEAHCCTTAQRLSQNVLDLGGVA